MSRFVALVLLVCSLFPLPLAADPADDLARALTEMQSANWQAALATAGPAGAPGRDVIEWHRLRTGMGTAQDVMDFVRRRPDWPGLDWLRAKGEPAVAAGDRAAMMAFFTEYPPQTPEGILAHAEALIANGQKGDGEAEIVLAWRTMAMSDDAHAAYVTGHRKLLAPHHAARLDRLLWDNHQTSARRMLPLVDEGRRALAEARIALHDMAAGVDTRIAAVPKALQDDAGLAFDRFVWRDRKNRDADAVDLLLERSSSAAALGEPGYWAKRRVDLARQLMLAGDPARAYRVAARHFTTPEAGYSHAELEWMAGYLSLVKLDDPAAALRHFKLFDAAVDSPISKGRSGYWLGRAHDALKQPAEARAAYAMAARYQTSFYGLLAAERAGLPFDPALRTPPAQPAWRNAPFMSSSVLEAGLLLLASGEIDLAERFLTHLVESLDETAALQLGQMAVDMDQPHLALLIAKRAAQRGIVLYGAYYPLHPVGRMKLPMAPEMTLAIARRESEFDPKVISGAGARGLMQVMPATAKAVADQLGIMAAHDTARLTREWDYNAQLGANYLAKLAGDLGGNVVMMAAGYNAGPGRPLSWMAKYGDPRNADPVDDAAIVDWIESIPFDETRNYVMRVTESLPVYRARLGLDPLPVPFSRELTGSTLLAFAP